MSNQKLIEHIDLFYKVARKQEDLAVLNANIGNYIHFSNSDRFGISFHKNVHPGNPRGIYGFPLTINKFQGIIENKTDIFYDYGTSKYIYVFGVSGNILDIDNIDLQDAVNKIRQFVERQYPQGAFQTTHPFTPRTKSGPEFFRWLNKISRDIFKNEHSGVNVLLRGMGYDAVETKNYGFGDDIGSEIVVVNPQSANLIAKINNPMLSKENLKEIAWLESPAYLKELESRKNELLQRQKKREEEVAQSKKFSEESKQFYQIERQLIKERKFDELERKKIEFKAKWKQFYL